MTYNPPRLRQLGAYWESRGGVNLGVVGNAAHRTGYHLGRDRIYGPNGQGDADYSVKLARDRSGLTDAASAIDLGRLDGSLAELRRFSRALVALCQSDATMRADVREIIYSPDGDRVMRWSGVDNAIHSGPGNGDLSHRTHTHVSYFRDAEARDKRPPFAAILERPTEVIAMKLSDPVALDGSAEIIAPDGYYLWRVSDDTKSEVLPKGTRWDYGVMGRVRYHTTSDRPDGWPGLLVSHAGELHVLPEGLEGQLARFDAAVTTTEAYNRGNVEARRAFASGGDAAAAALLR